MDGLTREFLLESYENLDRLDQDFVKLEAQPGNLELLKSIFRTIHTIKGTCGFLGFTKLETLAHAGESLLSILRDGHLVLTAEITTALLAMVDAVRGAGEVAQNIQGVAEAAQSTSYGATDSQKAAKSLAKMSTHLRGLVGRFKLEEDRLSGRRRTSDSNFEREPRQEVREEELAMK